MFSFSIVFGQTEELNEEGGLFIREKLQTISNTLQISGDFFASFCGIQSSGSSFVGHRKCLADTQFNITLKSGFLSITEQTQIISFQVVSQKGLEIVLSNISFTHIAYPGRDVAAPTRLPYNPLWSDIRVASSSGMPIHSPTSSVHLLLPLPLVLNR